MNAAKPALTVATALPSQVTLPVKLSANGNITAWQEAVIGSESNGLRLVQVQANVGDQVKADFNTADYYQGAYLINQAVNELCPAQIWQLRQSAGGYTLPPV